MIEFDYDGVDNLIAEFEQNSKGLEDEVVNYLNIINDINSSNKWISKEKVTVLSMAKGQYLDYISKNMESIENLKKQVSNKKNDFIDAENEIKALSI